MTLNNKRLGLELPGKEEVVAMLFPLESKKVASKRRLPTEMMRLLLKLNAYPKTKLANQATDMRTRINKLGPMLGHLNRLYNQRQALIRSSGLNEDGLKFYRNWVTMRKGYLETLLDYKTNPKRRRKLRILMAMCTHSYNFVRVFQKDSDKLKYVQVTGFKAFEKIDPLHRKDVAMQTRVGEGFSNSLKERYELWINAEVNRHKDPSDPDTLIDFFISIDDKPMDRTGYFSKGQDALAEVTFQTRLARARYVWCGADGKRKLCRYNPKGYPVAKRMVYRGYHTLPTPVGQTGRQVTYATGSNRVVHQDPVLTHEHRDPMISTIQAKVENYFIANFL